MPSGTKNRYRTKQPVVIEGFTGGGSIPYTPFTVPEGLRCKPAQNGMGAKMFFLDELPLALFPAGSCLRHDATYYGVLIPEEAVEDVTPPPMDWLASQPLTSECVVSALAAAVQSTLVPYTMKRIKGVYVYLQLKPGTLGFRVSRRAGEVLEAQEEVLYDGFNADDAVRAFKEATL